MKIEQKTVAPPELTEQERRGIKDCHPISPPCAPRHVPNGKNRKTMKRGGRGELKDLKVTHKDSSNKTVNPVKKNGVVVQ